MIPILAGAAVVVGAFLGKARGARVAVGLFGLFFIVGAGVLYRAGVQLKRSLAARNWPVVAGTVVQSDLKVRRSQEGVSFAPHVVYRYAFGRHEYTARRIWLSGQVAGPRSWAERVVQRYPRGQRVRVYVNPQDPAESVLEPGFRFVHVLLFLLGAVFLLGGLVGMVGFTRAAHKRPGAPARGPRRLKPMGPAWFLLVFAGFWFLLLVPAAVEAFRLVRQGRWTFTVWVALGFAAIGLGVLVWGIALVLQALPLRRVRVVPQGEPRVGGPLCLELRGLPLQQDVRVYVALSCVRVFTWRMGRERYRREFRVWSQEEVLGRRDLVPGLQGARARVCFRPPRHLPPSRSGRVLENPEADPTLPQALRKFLSQLGRRVEEQVVWTVEVHLDRWGPDAGARVLLWVGPPQEGTAVPIEFQEEPSSASFLRTEPEGWLWQPERYRWGLGGLVTLVAAVLGIVLGGLGTVSFWRGAGFDRVAAVVFAFFFLLGVYLVFHALFLWFGNLRVRRYRNTVEVQWSFLGVPLRRRRIPADEIQEVRLLDPRANSRFRVEIRWRSGKAWRFGASFSQAEARELVEALKPDSPGP